MNKILKSALLMALLLIANPAFAAIMNGDGGYTMTQFQLPTPDGSSATSATSMDGDVVDFMTRTGSSHAGSAVSMTVGDSVLDAANDDWWSGIDNEFYHTNSYGWVELHLPTNTLAFSLSIDAKYSPNAWIMGVADDGSAINTEGEQFNLLSSGYFDSSPGWDIQLGGAAQTFAFHVDNSSGSCGTLSKIVIEPPLWGMGDFSINVGADPCAQVREPSILVLFAAGLFGLGLARRKVRS